MTTLLHSSSTATTDRLRALVAAQPMSPAELKDFEADPELLERLLQHQVELLNGYGPQDLGTPIDWMHAPRGDLQWPTHLSRHYWLFPLAVAYYRTGEEVYAEKVVEVLLDWVERFPIGVDLLERGRPEWTNPSSDPALYEMFFKGYCDGPWTSLSAHVRFDSWCKLFQLLHGSDALTKSAMDRLLDSLMGDHVEVMLDFPRKMNQFQGIASSLVQCGWYFPEEQVSERAERVGWERMRRWTSEQIYPDGSVAECSPNYGMGCVRRVDLIVKKSREIGCPERPELSELEAAVSRAVRYYALTRDPGGHSPRLAKGGQYILDELRQLDPTAVEQSTALSAVFAWAGHAVARTGWGKDADWFFFDMGPRGSGHHNRAQLGVQLSVDGHALLVDPGYYSYSGEGRDGQLNRYFANTAAHNAALVDGEGQISALPGMENQPNREPGEYPISDDTRVFQATAKYSLGFGPAGETKVVQHRTVTFDRVGRTLIVDDSFEGQDSHQIALHWQLSPEAEAQIEDQCVKVEFGDHDCVIEVDSQTPLTLDLVSGREEPILGWYSQRYGHLVATNTLVASTTGMLPLNIQSRIRWRRRPSL